jgi:hypothetical protein
MIGKKNRRKISLFGLGLRSVLVFANLQYQFEKNRTIDWKHFVSSRRRVWHPESGDPNRLLKPFLLPQASESFRAIREVPQSK